MQLTNPTTPFRLALLLVTLFVGGILYCAAYLLIGPWDLVLHVTAQATSHEGKLHAEVYRQGFGYSWQAHYRIFDSTGLIIDRLLDGMDTIDEPGRYFSEIRFNRTDTTLFIGPHASHQTEIRDYYRIDLSDEHPNSAAYHRWPITRDIEHD